jgi:hypothetical protein
VGPDHPRFSSPVTPNLALAAPTVLQSAITAREPLCFSSHTSQKARNVTVATLWGQRDIIA